MTLSQHFLVWTVLAYFLLTLMLFVWVLLAKTTRCLLVRIKNWKAGK